jgi:Na+/serine symporter
MQMHILEQSEDTVIGKVARGSSAKRASALMNYGNLIAILIPFPLLIFWFGASMLVYAMNRHHPNPKVGHYTQQAAYRFSESPASSWWRRPSFLAVVGSGICWPG